MAIAILLLSSSVPENFNELWLFVKDLIPFGVCILFIYWIWRQHVIFFLRYGILDTKISLLNLALLFFVLFYVYPLKFLVTWLMRYFLALFSGTLGAKLGVLTQMIPMEKMPHLMIIYGLGFASIWLSLYFMYRHALHKRLELGLNKIEVYETRFSLNYKLYLTLIGGFSMVIALISAILDFPVGSALAGWAYNLIWVIAIIGTRKRKKQLRLWLEGHS